LPYLNLPFHQLRYHDTGGNKPVLVLCHSFGMRAEMFAPQLEAFAADYRCITWDQRAHGESPAAHAFSFWDSAKDLLALMDHLGIERAALAGTSQGGFVVLRAALLAPCRVSSIAVFGSSADEESEETKKGYRHLLDAVRASSFYSPADTVFEAMAGICFGPNFDASVWKRSWAVWSPEQFELAFRTLNERDSIIESLGRLTLPALVLHGDQDAAYASIIGRRIADAIPGAQFEIVERGQHFLSVTDAPRVNAALQRFLRSAEERAMR
jgi:pimeloyl-ACP methyl ester carboxylesterase